MSSAPAAIEKQCCNSSLSSENISAANFFGNKDFANSCKKQGPDLVSRP